MKEFWKRFFKIGAMFSWGGPVIIAFIWFCLYKSGVITSLSVEEVVVGVYSSLLLAFVAAGISQIYSIESMPLVTKSLIQAAVLYIDYLGIYLLNGWINKHMIIWFTLIFLGIFIIIWLIIYFVTRNTVDKANRKMAK